MKLLVKTVYVMMSTYNGEKYIREQIDSILAQQGVQVELVVRDDGSTDSTKSILDEYQAKGQLSWYTGENLRTCQSFLHLLFNAPERDFYAFADQDDYWHKDKLISAVRMIDDNNSSGAKMYFCKKNIVDSNLKPMGVDDTKVNRVSYGVALLHYGVTCGCTMVFNHNAFELTTKYLPKRATMHDSWIYKIISAFGTVIYDETPHIDYRQHGNNVMGTDKSFRRRVFLGIKNLSGRKKDKYRSEGAQEMLNAFGGELSERDRKLTEQLANAPKSISARLKLIFNSDLKCQGQKELVFVKIFVLLGWI